jgi:hypothetical protein
MGRRNQRDRSGASSTDWENERTLAAAEEDAASDSRHGGTAVEGACACGHRELLLQAYLRVVDGKPDPEPLEVETLTCPECGREFEAIQLEGGRVVCGDFLGYADLDED